jgi:hypothetical protein
VELSRRRPKEIAMDEERKDKRFRMLSDQVIDFIQEHGAGKPKGLVKQTEIRKFLEISESEWKELYYFMFDHKLVETDGRNEHMRLP